MIEEYFISEDTLMLLPLSKNETKILDISGEYIIEKNIFEVVDESCQYYGSTYNGRYISAKKTLDMDYKLPIIIDEVKEVVLFPTCSPKLENCIWICVNNVENYIKNNKVSVIKFTNGVSSELNISINTLENQILRATMLLMKLKKRKSNPKKIGV
ncbi:MAG TPA: competence protein ComK [Candidatus Faecisoma merdavium]|nr:competence protein ComK [Candidatus Faecisoma merdavium]